MNFKKILKFQEKLILCLFLINLTSCLGNKEIITSNYCFLYSPFPDNIDSDIINFWIEKQKVIENKNKNGNLKTVEEKFIEIFIEYAGSNDKIYYDKNCGNID